MVGRTDDVTALETAISAEKDKAIQAHARLEELEAAHRTAADYEAATAFEAEIKRHQWTITHADEIIPELESRLAAARAARQRQAIERHWTAARNLYPKLRTALLGAANLQAQAIALRNAAAAELGEAVVERHIPRVTFVGLLFDNLIESWSKEVNRSFQTPPNQKPALQAVEKPAAPLIDLNLTAKVTAEHSPPPEPATAPPRRPQKRPLLADGPPGEGERQIQLLRNGVQLELPDVTLQSLTGDCVNVPADQALALVRNGAAEYVTKQPAAETGGDAA